MLSVNVNLVTSQCMLGNTIIHKTWLISWIYKRKNGLNWDHRYIKQKITVKKRYKHRYMYSWARCTLQNPGCVSYFTVFCVNSKTCSCVGHRLSGCGWCFQRSWPKVTQECWGRGRSQNLGSTLDLITTPITKKLRLRLIGEMFIEIFIRCNKVKWKENIGLGV